jgi:hypothetical protein
MKLARQLSKGLFDVLSGGVTRDPERFVIVFVFHGHNSLCTGPSIPEVPNKVMPSRRISFIYV